MTTEQGGRNLLPILELDGLEHHLRDEERPEEYVVYVRQRITIMPGDFVALLGPSGCGKTTLLTILGLLRRPTDPESLDCFSIGVTENGRSKSLDLKEAWCRNRQQLIERARRQHMGFALQTGELLPALTVRENIAVPLRVNGVTATDCRTRVDELIGAFQLRRSVNSPENVSHRTEGRRDEYDLSMARINKLSGGEYQRVSLARAMSHRPRLVFVDEPTASLNREMARDALQQFRSLQQDASDPGATIMITHDEVLAQDFANVTIRMAPLRNQAAGEVVDITRHHETTPAANNSTTEDRQGPGTP